MGSDQNTNEDLKKTLNDLNASLGSLAQLPTSISILNGKVGDLGEALVNLKAAIGDINPNIKAAINDSQFVKEVKALTEKVSSLVEETNDANARAALEQESREKYTEALNSQTKAMNELKKTNEDKLNYDKEQQEKEAKKEEAVKAKEKKTEELEKKNEKLTKQEGKFTEGESGGYLSKLTGINASGKGYIAAKDRITENIDNLKIKGKDPAELGLVERLLKATGASKYTDKALDRFGAFQQKNLDKEMPEEAKQYKKLQRERKKLDAIAENEETRPEGDLGELAKAEFRLKKGFNRITDKNGVEKIQGPNGKFVSEESAIDKRFKRPEIISSSEINNKKNTRVDADVINKQSESDKYNATDSNKEKSGLASSGKSKERVEVEIIGINSEVAKTLADSIANVLKSILEDQNDITNVVNKEGVPVNKVSESTKKQEDSNADVNPVILPGLTKAPAPAAAPIAQPPREPSSNKENPEIISSLVELVGGAAPLIGGAADGGTIEARAPTIVGERGPELFTPSTQGKVTPNSELRDMSRRASSVKSTSAIQRAADGPSNTNISNNNLSNVTGSSVTENIAQNQTSVSASSSEALNTVATTAPTLKPVLNNAPSNDMLLSISQTLQEISNKLANNIVKESSGGGMSTLASNNTSSQMINIIASGNPITNSRLKTDSMMYSRRAAN